MRLFVRVPHAWCTASLAAIDEVAQATEEFGFQGVSVQDHLLSDATVAPCGHLHAGDDRTVFEALGVLTYLAGRTRRVRLLAGVLVLPYRHPVLLAKEAATLDVLSNGRLVFGVGIGALLGRGADAGQRLGAHARIAAREFEAMGVSGDRGALVDEYLTVIEALWASESASFAGRHVRFEDLVMLPRPVQRPRPPIWIGGRSAAARRRAALRGDGWFPSQAPAESVAEGRRQIAAIAAEHGRPAPRDVGVSLFAAVGTSDGAAQQTIADGLGRRYENLDALRAATIAGTPATVLRRIEGYRAAGATALDLKILPLRVPDTLHQLRLLAAEVLPALASAQA
jgi:probable F420-dependent oxidoreductase